MNFKCVENVWSFDPFQDGRFYKFRVKSNDEVIRARYICEKTKGQKLDPMEREYEFLVGDQKQVFKASEIIDPQYSGI
ncbi:MAG TPA: hypothetical protein VLH08_03795 [Acidobacteriota bacterium]|nr:hypothetical protein [Acidobacteriota bacterium]